MATQYFLYVCAAVICVVGCGEDFFDGYEMDNIDEAPAVSVERPSSSGVNEFTPVEEDFDRRDSREPMVGERTDEGEESESPGRVTTDDALADDEDDNTSNAASRSTESDGQASQSKFDGDDREDSIDDETYGPIRIQVIGDSHLAWNGEQSTGHQISDVLEDAGIQHFLINHAVGGSTLGCGQGGIGTAENCIPPQLEPGDWTHVVLSGGGNDFLESGCSVDVDKLISPDFNSGLMVDLVTRVNELGARAVITGYVSPLDADGEAGSCAPIHTLLDRYQQFAETTDGVAYVPGRRIIQPSRPEDYDDDIHTSIRGSRRMAEAIAQYIVPTLR